MNAAGIHTANHRCDWAATISATFSDCAPVAAEISANISGSSKASPWATNRYPPIRLSAELAPQPAIHSPAQVSTSIALNHTTPTLIRLAVTVPNGITSAASIPAAGTVHSPSRHNRASGASVTRRCATSSRAVPAAGPAAASRAGRPAALAASSASVSTATAAKPARTAGTTSTDHSGALVTIAYHPRLHPGRKLVKIGVQAGDDQPGRGQLGTRQQPGQHRDQPGRRRPAVSGGPAGRREASGPQRRGVIEAPGGTGQISAPLAVPGRDVPAGAQRRAGYPGGRCLSGGEHAKTAGQPGQHPGG